MSHILVVDVGNSRMKWALVSARGVVAQGAVPNAEIGTLALRAVDALTFCTVDGA